MRIAILAPEFLPTWGGVGIYTVELVRELSKYPDLELHVITPKRGKDYDKSKILEEFGNRIHLHNISKANDTFFYNAAFQLAVLKDFSKLHKKYNFDLIHSMNLVHMPDIFLKFFKEKIPSIVTAHTTIKGQVLGFLNSNKNFFKMAPSEKMSILLYPYISLLEKIYLKKTNSLITVSEKFVDIFTKDYKYNKKISAIHNGIDLNRYISSDVDKDKYCKKYGVNKNNINILFAGRLITQKGIEEFVKIINKIITEKYNDKIHFVIAGIGDVSILDNLLKRYNIPKERYMFLGAVPNKELHEVYDIIDIFLLPSFYENFPISLLEAMAMKCACIATDVGAVDEIIKNNHNGFLIEAGDTKKMIGHIKSLIEDKSLYQKITNNAYNDAKNRFSSEIMAKKTYDFYKEVLR